MDQLHQAVTEYFVLTDLPKDEQARFLSIHHSDEIVEEALKQPGELANAFFIAAIGSAGSHMHIVHDSDLNSAPLIFVKSIAKLLKYAKAIGDTSQFEEKGYVPVAFVFNAVWTMCAAALKNLEVFIGLTEQFEELLTRLRLKKGDLHPTHQGHTSTTTLISALVEIIIFCGQVTKFMNGIFIWYGD
jgi:hypothetical protein